MRERALLRHGATVSGWSGRSRAGVTAIDKRPAAGRVAVRPLGLTADLQADRVHHGGEDQAVYAYAQEDADFWSAALGYEVTPGLFGENLRPSRSRSRGRRAPRSSAASASRAGSGGWTAKVLAARDPDGVHAAP